MSRKKPHNNNKNRNLWAEFQPQGEKCAERNKDRWVRAVNVWNESRGQFKTLDRRENCWNVVISNRHPTDCCRAKPSRRMSHAASFFSQKSCLCSMPWNKIKPVSRSCGFSVLPFNFLSFEQPHFAPRGHKLWISSHWFTSSGARGHFRETQMSFCVVDTSERRGFIIRMFLFNPGKLLLLLTVFKLYAVWKTISYVVVVKEADQTHIYLSC